MGNRYVKSTITRQSKAVSQQGFGLPLILGISKASPYKEYYDISEVFVDFAATTAEYKQAARLFGSTPKPEKVAIHSIVWNEATGDVTNLTAALNTLILTKNEFYFVHVATQDDEAIGAISDWTDTQKKMFFASTSNKTLSETLKSERSVLLVHNQPELYPAEAWVGYGAAQDAGSFTWTFKTLNGVVPSNYTGAEIDAIHEANGNTYIREGGVDITSAGKTTSGEYIDIVMGQDYLESRITEEIFGLLATTKKVPFTDAGIAMVVARLEIALKDAAGKEIIAKDAAGKPIFKIIAPTAAVVSKNDKANRTLPNVRWSATLAGAVEDVNVVGELAI